MTHLKVEGSFSVPTRGVAAIGRLWQGCVYEGDELWLRARGELHPVRVAGVEPLKQVFGEPESDGLRHAILLADLAEGDVPQGALLSADSTTLVLSHEGRAFDLARLLHGWRGVVRSVEDEAGYSWIYPEFLNDVWTRTFIAKAWPLLTGQERMDRQTELRELDNRFRATTVPWPIAVQDDGEWWRRRIPRYLADDDPAPYERINGWPYGWDMLGFPKPDEVQIVD